MSTISVELTDSLRAAAGEFARESGLSIGQLTASALAEKISAMAGPEWLAARAARGDRARFEEALGRVADVEPDEQDRL
jgi:post-segregation antitoxin (ccd killing protein)